MACACFWAGMVENLLDPKLNFTLSTLSALEHWKRPLRPKDIKFETK